MALEIGEIHVQSLQGDEGLVRAGAPLGFGEKGIAQGDGDALAEFLVLAVLVDQRMHALADFLRDAAEVADAGVYFEVGCQSREEAAVDLEEDVDGFVGGAEPDFKVALSWRNGADVVGGRFVLGD